jgi:hypothetical protein
MCATGAFYVAKRERRWQVFDVAIGPIGELSTHVGPGDRHQTKDDQKCVDVTHGCPRSVTKLQIFYPTFIRQLIGV